jgi:hypothetical protein
LWQCSTPSASAAGLLHCSSSEPKHTHSSSNEQDTNCIFVVAKIMPGLWSSSVCCCCFRQQP